jgi:hypothetical protein
MAEHDIRTFGGDPLSSDNTPAYNAMVAAAVVGDTVRVSAGDFTLRKTPSPWSGLVNKRLRLVGPGTLRMAPDLAANPIPFGNSNALLYFTSAASGSFIGEGLRLEGSKPNADGPTEYIGNEALEHHRGMFFDNCSDIVLDGYSVRNMTGDALQLYNGCKNYQIRNFLMEWCQRDHLTFSPSSPLTPVRGILVEDGIARGASNQQIDNEHGPAHDVHVRRVTLERANNLLSIGLAIAGSGTDSTAPSTNWTIEDCTVLGGIRFTWTSYSRIRRTPITCDRAISGVEFERMQAGNELVSCPITCTYTGPVANLAGVYVNGTNGGGASNLRIEDCDISVAKAAAFGIRADGIESIRAINNRLQGAGITAAGYYGIRVRATVPDRDIEFAVFHRNRVRDFGAAGLAIVGNLVGGKRAQVRHLEAVQNRFENTLPGSPQKVGLQLQDSANTLRSGLVAGNEFGTGITTQVVAAASPRVAYSFGSIAPGPAADVVPLGRAAELREASRGAEIGAGRTLRAEAA